MADVDGGPVKAGKRRRSAAERALPNTCDPIDMAMGGGGHEVARAVLEKQARLLDAQLDQSDYELQHLKVRRFNERLGVALRAVGVLLAVSLVIGLGSLVWNASRANALVVEPLRAPPDLAARGLDGTTLAQKLLDGLADMHVRTETTRTGGSLQNNWGDDLNVAIPQTGISMREVWRLLRRWLGEETRVTGEIVRTPGGELTITVRADADPGQSFTGPETELDSMIRRAAESVFGATQPYRYGSYLLDQPGRLEEARLVFTRLTTHRDAREHPWAWVGLANVARESGDLSASNGYAQQALRLDPGLQVAYNNLAINSELLGHWQALAGFIEIALTQRSGAPGDIDAARMERYRVGQTNRLKAVRGGFGDALALRRSIQSFPSGFQAFYWYNQLTGWELGAHETRAAAASLARTRAQPLREGPDLAMMWIDAARWRLGIAIERGSTPDMMAALAEAEQAAIPPSDGDAIAPSYVNAIARTRLRPMQARALARLGRLDEARALASQFPRDCYECLIVTGEIEAASGNLVAARRWFAEAVRKGPSLPFAEAAWGRQLLAHGEAERALAMFRAAHEKGPRWADPLKFWGDALARQRQYLEAIGRYEAAAERAPRWGALHMAWADALWRVGRQDEARRTLRAAATMDLSEGDRALLRRMAAVIEGRRI